MSDTKHNPWRTVRIDKAAASRALRLSVPAEARPAPVSRQEWLRQKKAQLQACLLYTSDAADERG